MQHVSTSIDKGLSNLLKEKDLTDESRLHHEAKGLIDILFLALQEHVTFFKLNHVDGYDYAKREWTKTFISSGISKKRLQIGIERIRTDGQIYASMTPNEFLNLCKVTWRDINAPDINTAYLEACKNSNPCETDKNWSHDAVRLATHRTGSYFIRTESKAETFMRFSKEYEITCAMAFDGLILHQLQYLNRAQEEETKRKQDKIAEGYEHLNSPAKAIDAIKDLLK